jgi:hypothetical protein
MPHAELCGLGGLAGSFPCESLRGALEVIIRIERQHMLAGTWIDTLEYGACCWNPGYVPSAFSAGTKEHYRLIWEIHGRWSAGTLWAVSSGFGLRSHPNRIRHKFHLQGDMITVFEIMLSPSTWAREDPQSWPCSARPRGEFVRPSGPRVSAGHLAASLQVSRRRHTNAPRKSE